MPDVNEVAGDVLDKHIKDMQAELNQLRPLKPKPVVFTFRALVVMLLAGAVLGWCGASQRFDRGRDRYYYEP